LLLQAGSPVCKKILKVASNENKKTDTEMCIDIDYKMMMKEIMSMNIACCLS
jgi:hypothetical protein